MSPLDKKDLIKSQDPAISGKPKDIDAERHPEEQLPPREFPSYEPKKVDDPLQGS